MEKSIIIGKDTFSYVNNGKYIRIFGYHWEDGTLSFKKEEDGRSYFHIHIPETIDGLPVLFVRKLYLDIDYGKGYRHNGYDIVKIHLPEDTAFPGLKQSRTGSGTLFVPNFTEEYYPRTNCLLRKDEGAYHFFAEKADGTYCNIIAIVRDNCIKKDWVWSKGSQEIAPEEKLVLPSQIDEYLVREICIDSTLALPECIKEVHVGDNVEIIGDECFSDLPYLTDVYLSKSVKSIGKGAFGYYENDDYVKKVPTLYVHYYDDMPQLGEDAFVRRADKEEYEEYSDWGNMHTGTTHLKYETLYIQNE